jgi:hypothetical protein
MNDETVVLVEIDAKASREPDAVEKASPDRSFETLDLEKWSERKDLNLRPLVSQTSALTGLRHAPMPFH